MCNWQIILPIVAALIGAIGGSVGGWLSGVRAAEIRIQAEQERQELLLKQSLYKGVLESLVVLNSKGSGAMFLLEAEKVFIYSKDPVVEALADAREKAKTYVDAVAAKKKADDAGAADLTVNKKADDAQEDWENARIKLLLVLRKGLQPKTKLDEEWLSNNWEALGAELAEVEKVLSLRQQ